MPVDHPAILSARIGNGKALVGSGVIDVIGISIQFRSLEGRGPLTNIVCVALAWQNAVVVPVISQDTEAVLDLLEGRIRFRSSPYLLFILININHLN